MKNGTCPKCNASEIYSNAEARIISRNRLGTDTWSLSVPLHVYMWKNCGYLEYYVPYQEGREQVARKWPSVPPPTQGS